jgi:hypothetical protein
MKAILKHLALLSVTRIGEDGGTDKGNQLPLFIIMRG